MIIRNEVTQMLKASTLNNRAVRSTPGSEAHTASTLKESPIYAAVALFQSAFHSHLSAVGPSDTAVIER